MRSTVICFNIDYLLTTSFIQKDNKKVKWNGGKQTWLDACKQLKQLGSEHYVDIHFALVSDKHEIDEFVIEAVTTLRDYLFSTTRHPLIKSSEKKYFPVVQEDNAFDVCLHGNHYKVDNGLLLRSDRISSVHLVDSKNKTSALFLIKDMFGVEDPAKFFLVEQGDPAATIATLLIKIQTKISHLRIVCLREMIEFAQEDEVRNYLAIRMPNQQTLLRHVIAKHPVLTVKLLSKNIVSPAYVLSLDPDNGYAQSLLPAENQAKAKTIFQFFGFTAKERKSSSSSRGAAFQPTSGKQ